MRTEPIYSTLFKTEAVPAELLESWATVLPGAEEALAYPPPNLYVPARMPQPCRAPRNEEDPIGKPVRVAMLEETSKSELWFKQDDQFEQPHIYAHVRIDTNDLNSPHTAESQIFSTLWQQMF